MNKIILGGCGFLLSISSSASAATQAPSASSADEMHLSDEPGNWFRSEATGTPVTVIEGIRPRTQ
jgi:hypothetical protein